MNREPQMRPVPQAIDAPGQRNPAQPGSLIESLAAAGSIRAAASQLDVRPAVLRLLLRHPALICDDLASVATSLDGITPDHWPTLPGAQNAWVRAWHDLRDAGADEITLSWGMRILARQSRGCFDCTTPIDPARRLALPLRRLLLLLSDMTQRGDHERTLVSRALQKLMRLSVRGVIDFHDSLAKASREHFDALLKQSCLKTGGFTAPSLFRRNLGGLDLMPLRGAADLNYAARGLKNCLAGYQFDLISGDNVLLAIRDGPQWVAAIHIALFEHPPHAIAFEARGPHNQTIPVPIAKLSHALAASVGADSAKSFCAHSCHQAQLNNLDIPAFQARLEALERLVR